MLCLALADVKKVDKNNKAMYLSMSGLVMCAGNAFVCLACCLMNLMLRLGSQSINEAVTCQVATSITDFRYQIC